MITKEQKTNAIDALIRNIGEDGVTAAHFMLLLSIGPTEAEDLMMELYEQKKLDLKWVAGEYYNK